MASRRKLKLRSLIDFIGHTHGQLIVHPKGAVRKKKGVVNYIRLGYLRLSKLQLFHVFMLSVDMLFEGIGPLEGLVTYDAHIRFILGVTLKMFHEVIFT